MSQKSKIVFDFFPMIELIVKTFGRYFFLLFAFPFYAFSTKCFRSAKSAERDKDVLELLTRVEQAEDNERLADTVATPKSLKGTGGRLIR